MKYSEDLTKKKNQRLTVFSSVFGLSLCVVVPTFGTDASALPDSVGDSPLKYTATGPSFTPDEKASQSRAAASIIANLKTGLAAGSKNLVIPPGDYRFDNPGIESFSLADVDNFTITATGATFWCDGSHGINFTNCHNVALTGLTIDSDPIPWVQGIIKAIDKTRETIDFQVDDGYPLPTGGGAIVYFNKDTGRELNAFDEGANEVEPLEGRLFRITKLGSSRVFRDPVFPRPLAIGDKLVLCTGGGGNIVQDNCGNDTLQNVTVYAAGGFVYVERGGAGANRYLDCKLVRRPQTSRLMASPHDCLHSVLMEKGPIITNCEFANAGDDLIAIHGNYGMVTQDADSDQIRVATLLGPNVATGSKLQFLDPATGKVDQEATVVEMTVGQPGPEETADAMGKKFAARNFSFRGIEPEVLMQISLDHSIHVSALEVVSSDHFCGNGAVISDCQLHDGHCRAIITKTSNLTIKDNVIERPALGGIVLEPEFFWLEGPANIGAVITGNRLIHCGWSTFDRVGMTCPQAAIHVGSWAGVTRLFPRLLLDDTQPNQHIDIEQNTIEQPAGQAISVANTNDVTIKNNMIVHPFAAGDHPAYFRFSRLIGDGQVNDTDQRALDAPYYAIFVRASQNVTIQGNQVSGAPPFYAGDAWQGAP